MLEKSGYRRLRLQFPLCSLRMDPSHHAKATNIVEVDGLEPEEAEVREVNPSSGYSRDEPGSSPNAGYILFRDSFGLADEGRPRSPKRITVDPRLPDEEAAPRVGLQRPLS